MEGLIATSVGHECAPFNYVGEWRQERVGFCQAAQVALANIVEVGGVKYDMNNPLNRRGELLRFCQMAGGRSGEYSVPAGLARELQAGKYEPVPTKLECLGKAVSQLCGAVSRLFWGDVAGVELSVGSKNEVLATGDVDGDGKSDLLVDNGSGLMVIYGELAEGGHLIPGLNFTMVTHTSGRQVNPWEIGLADLSGDGTSDFISFEDSVIIYTQPGRRPRTLIIPPEVGTYQTTQLTGFTPVTPLAAVSPNQINVGDVNGDGTDDIGFLWQIDGYDAGFGVLQGKKGGLGTTLDMVTSKQITGASLGDLYGNPVAVQRGGDLNGDGLSEVVYVSRDTSQVNGIGTAFVVYGTAQGLPYVRLSDPETRMTAIWANATHNVGITAAANLNLDGFDDLIVEVYPFPGQMQMPAPHSSYYIVWGGPTGLPPNLSLTNISKLATEVDGVNAYTTFFSYNETGIAVVAPMQNPSITYLLAPRTGKWPQKVSLYGSATQLWGNFTLNNGASPNRAGLMATGPLNANGYGPSIVAGADKIYVVDVDKVG